MPSSAVTLKLGVTLDVFAQAIAGPTPFKTDGTTGRRDIRIIEAVYVSVAPGGEIVSIVA